MKQLNVTFEDEEFEEMLSVKGNTPWREFLIKKINNKKKEQVEVYPTK